MKKYSLIVYIREETKQNLRSINNYQTYEKARIDLEKEVQSLGLSLEKAEEKYETPGEKFYASWNNNNIIIKIC